MADIVNTSWTEVDSGNVFQPPLGWPAGMYPNAVEPTSQAMMGALKRFWTRLNPVYAASLSTTDTFAVAPSQAITGYNLYERWRVRFPSPTLTTSPSLIISSLPVQLIKKYDGAGNIINPSVGDIQAQDYEMWWDGNEFILDGATSSSGMWTPSLFGSGTSGTQTYSSQVGTWNKVGNVVFVMGRLVLTANSGGTGSARIGGFPIPQSANSLLGFSADIGFYSGITLDSGYTQLAVSAGAGATTSCLLTENGSAQTSQGLPIANVSATASIKFNAFYFLAP